MTKEKRLAALKALHYLVGNDFDFREGEADLFLREHYTAINDCLSAQEPEWQPIETAPRDGTELILAYKGVTYSGRWYVHKSICGWVTDFFDCSDCDFEPTHWQALPQPPSGKE